MTQIRNLVLVPLAAAALLLGACGDDDVDTSGTTVAPADDAATDDSSDGADGTDGSAGGSGEVPDACGLVEAAEVEALIGEAASPESEADVAIDGLAYSQCSWETADALFVVAVVEGTDRHEMHREIPNAEDVDGVGDRAITAGGVSSETMGATGGRTISAEVDGSTLVVALKVQGQTTVDLVAPIATTVAERLAAAS